MRQTTHRGRRELATGKRRCAHLARMFRRTARIVKHLDADVLDNLLSERLR